MHLLSCLHPKVIINPYTHKTESVSCGCCAACRLSRQMIWVQRLNQESYDSTYTYFVTLHYDEKHVPKVYRTPDFTIYNPLTGECFSPISDGYIDDRRDFEFLNGQRSFNVASVRDCQLFFKRLRRIIDYYAKKEEVSEDLHLRYYLASDIGGSTLRPHYHMLLWFESRWLRSKLTKFILKAWPFDNQVNIQPVRSSAAQYVASYINCLTHLPSFYRHRLFRPFFLCSRFPAIGTRKMSNEEVSRLIFDSVVERPVYYPSTGSFKLCPLWRSTQDRIFPKLPRFGALSRSERVSLYGAVKFFGTSTYKDFRETVMDFSIKFPNLPLSRYVRSFYRPNHSLSYDGRVSACDKQFDNFMLRFWSISNRVCRYCDEFGFTVDFYVDSIDKYYSRKDLKRLSEWYSFQQDSLDENSSLARCFLQSDISFFSSLLKEIEDGSIFSDIVKLYILESYGITKTTDIYLLRSFKLDENPLYFSFKKKFEDIEKKNTKSKINKAYLEEHKAKFYNYYRFLQSYGKI